MIGTVRYQLLSEPPRPAKLRRGKPPVWEWRIMALLLSLPPRTVVATNELSALDDGTVLTESHRDCIRRALNNLARKGELVLLDRPGPRYLMHFYR